MQTQLAYMPDGDGQAPVPIKVVREAHGRTQRSVAHQAGLNPAQLSRAERGLGGLSLESLYRVAIVLGMDILSSQIEPYLSDPELRDRASWDDPEPRR